MNLEDTRIESAGVMRCCLETVAQEYEGKNVKLGDKSKCLYCNEPFTLVDVLNIPIWRPDWQLAEDWKP